MAPALNHHLALVGNRPMEGLAESFRGLEPWVPIAYIPETDAHVRLLAGRRGGMRHEDEVEAFEQ